MKLNYNIATFSETGKHSEKEDFFEVQIHPQDENCRITVITDGLEGRSGGRVAAGYSCKLIIEKALNYHPKKLTNPKIWKKILQSVDKEILNHESAGLTATLGLAIYSNKVAGASNGECTALLVSRNGKFENFTKGQLKNPLMGSGNATILPFGSKIDFPASVLLLSSGVTKNVPCGKILSYTIQRKGLNVIESLYNDVINTIGGKLYDDFTGVALSIENN